MSKIDPKLEAEFEAKVIEINKLDLKLHLAKRELRDSICDALCSVLPRDSEPEAIVKAAKAIKAYKVLDSFDKKKVIKSVYDRLNS